MSFTETEAPIAADIKRPKEMRDKINSQKSANYVCNGIMQLCIILCIYIFEIFLGSKNIKN
jgi:hypothetical protein